MTLTLRLPKPWWVRRREQVQVNERWEQERNRIEAENIRLMKENAPVDTCRRCGGSNLQPDPSAYYIDAVDREGRPMLCTDHKD